MAENNLATLIRGVCHDVGKMKGIEFHLPATWGMEAPGRWEAGYKRRRQGRSTVILSYWFSVTMHAARRGHFALGVPAHIGTR